LTRLELPERWRDADRVPTAVLLDQPRRDFGARGPFASCLARSVDERFRVLEFADPPRRTAGFEELPGDRDKRVDGFRSWHSDAGIVPGQQQGPVLGGDRAPADVRALPGDVAASVVEGEEEPPRQFGKLRTRA